MDQNYHSGIRLNQFGQPDIDSYINETKRLRALAISQLLHEMAHWLKTYLGKQPEFPLRPSL